MEFIRGIDLDQIKHKEFYYKHIDVYQKHDYPRINRNNTTAFKIFRAIINRCLRMIKLPQKLDTINLICIMVLNGGLCRKNA